MVLVFDNLLNFAFVQKFGFLSLASEEALVFIVVHYRPSRQHAATFQIIDCQHGGKFTWVYQIIIPIDEVCY